MQDIRGKGKPNATKVINKRVSRGLEVSVYQTSITPNNTKRGGYPHRIVASRLMIEIRFNPCSRVYAPNDQALSYAYEYSLALPQHTRYL